MLRLLALGCVFAAACFAQDAPAAPPRFQPRVPQMPKQPIVPSPEDKAMQALPQERSRELPQQQMRRWMQEQQKKNESWQRAAVPGAQVRVQAPEKCAHMMTYVPPKDLDAKIAVGKFTDSGRMPQIPAMPTCAADIRVLPSLNKTPETPPTPEPAEPPAAEPEKK